MNKQEAKILFVLEQFLSLHEADTVFNLINDDSVEIDGIDIYLQTIKEEEHE